MARQSGALERAPSAISLSQQKVRIDFVLHLKDSTSLYSVEMERGAALKDAVHTLPLNVRFKEGSIGSWIEEIEGMGEIGNDGKKTGFGWQFYINRDGETGLPYTVKDTAYFPGVDDFKVNTNIKVEWKYECYECDIDCSLLAAKTKETNEEFHLFTGKEFDEEDTFILKTSRGSEWKDDSRRPDQDTSKCHILIESNQAFSYAVEISSPEQPIYGASTDDVFNYIAVSGGCHMNDTPANIPVQQFEKEKKTELVRAPEPVANRIISKTKHSTVSILWMTEIRQRFVQIASRFKKLVRGAIAKVTEAANKFKAAVVRAKKTIETALQKAMAFMSHAREEIKKLADRIVAPISRIKPAITKFIQNSKTKTSAILSFISKAPSESRRLLLEMNQNRGKRAAAPYFFDLMRSGFSLTPQQSVRYILTGVAALAVIIFIAVNIV